MISMNIRTDQNVNADIAERHTTGLHDYADLFACLPSRSLSDLDSLSDHKKNHLT